MFRITEDPSSGSLVQCLAKNYKNGSIVSIGMDEVGVMAAYFDLLCVCVVPSYTVNYTHAQQVTICCHNTDHVHVNGHDRIMLVIFSQALYKTP
jgi:ribonuclease HIII